MKREPGFYWVNYLGTWCVCEWESDGWWMTGVSTYYDDSDFEEIDPTPIKHNRA